jgi:DNA-binding MarR family transcriptional regulator
MTKVTKETIELMNKLLKEGKNLVEIAKTLNLSPSTVSYHLNKEQKEKQIERVMKIYKKKSKKQISLENKKKRKYQSAWFKNKYKTDEVFRKKVIANSMRYKLKKRLNKK